MSAHAVSENVAHTIKTAIAVFAASIGLILVIFMLAQYAVGAYAGRPRQGDPVMSAVAVAERLKPVGEATVDANAPAPVAAAAQVPAAPAAGAAPGNAADLGKSTYASVCVACHGSGAAGAPKIGDKAAWTARIAQGKDALYASALKGKGVMPAKGGNPAIADDAVKAAVDYLVSQAQ